MSVYSESPKTCLCRKHTCSILGVETINRARHTDPGVPHLISPSICSIGRSVFWDNEHLFWVVYIWSPHVPSSSSSLAFVLHFIFYLFLLVFVFASSSACSPAYSATCFLSLLSALPYLFPPFPLLPFPLSDLSY